MKTLIIRLLLVFIGFTWFLSISVQAEAASLRLSPPTLSVTAGSEQTLSLTLDPEGAEVVGVDVLLTYNPSYLTISRVDSNGVFADRPATIIDNQTGRATFSLAEPYGSYQTEAATIATLLIRGGSISSGTPLSFIYTPGSTTDTNVVARGGQDLLSAVSATTITVVTDSGPGPSPTPSPSPSPSPSPTPTIKPGTGTAPGQTKPKPKPTKPPKSKDILSPLPDSGQAGEANLTEKVLGATEASPTIWFYLALFFAVSTTGLAGWLIKEKIKSSGSRIDPSPATVTLTHP